MIYESALFLIALAGSAVGGWIDLKTTEIPDKVPISMAAAGLLVHVSYALLTGVWTNVYYSIGVGILFLIFGYILYYTGQWGEADVLLLAAVGVIVPQPLSFFAKNMFMDTGFSFPAVFVLNTFIVGGIYSLIYSLILAFKNKSIFPEFMKLLKNSKKRFAKIALIVFFVSFLSMLIMSSVFTIRLSAALIVYDILVLVPAIIFIFLFYTFAQVIDTVAFKKKVKTEDLREGDVLSEDVAGLSSKLYIGLTEEQIKTVRDAKKEVWIKEGIRYGPTFFLALIATWLFGNVISLLINLL